MALRPHACSSPQSLCRPPTCCFPPFPFCRGPRRVPNSHRRLPLRLHRLCHGKVQGVGGRGQGERRQLHMCNCSAHTVLQAATLRSRSLSQAAATREVLCVLLSRRRHPTHCQGCRLIPSPAIDCPNAAASAVLLGAGWRVHVAAAHRTGRLLGHIPSKQRLHQWWAGYSGRQWDRGWLEAAALPCCPLRQCVWIWMGACPALARTSTAACTCAAYLWLLPTPSQPALA